MTSISAMADTTLLTTSSTTSSTTSTTTTAQEELEEDKLSFLTLLLTQLENQNPLDPMDTAEYTQQLVSYSQLEQQMDMNANLEAIATQLNESALTTNLSYIGQSVELETNISAVQDGAVNWSYLIDGAASDASLTVTDDDGNVIWESEGTTYTGVNSVDLDVSESGLEDGTLLYLSVSATDSSGDHLNTYTTTNTTVDGVTSDGSTTYLTSGGLSYTLDDVLKITS